MINLSKEKIDGIFEDAENSNIAADALYNIAFSGKLENIVAVASWPTVSGKTSEYLFGKFIDLDTKKNSPCVKGGAWLNSGFSSNNAMKDWQINVDTCTIKYK